MVAEKPKKSKVELKKEGEDSDHIDEGLVLSIEKLQEVQDELEKVNEAASDKVLRILPMGLIMRVKVPSDHLKKTASSAGLAKEEQKAALDGVGDEVAEIIKEDLWPNPLKYFNNEGDEDDFDGDDDDAEDKGTDEDEDDDDEGGGQDDKGEDDG
ncbi:hypothetical protein HPP92_013063 [Vanilla planifolia]|uniref:Uncharacterized protein n=1 Tax=Vanilla planifolia TaxID=51239 RepID=A0A835QWW2_VANPL|nr:hypothetical protein HPP92_013063 [Vanilla planifolia]